MKYKVATLFAPGVFGGAENIVLNGVKNLGCELWLIKEERNQAPYEVFYERCQDLNIQCLELGCKSRFDPKLWLSLYKLIKERGIHALHSHGMKANFYCALLPVKRIGTQHGKTSHNPQVKILEWIEDMSFKRMHSLVCVSKQIADTYFHKNLFLVENFALMNASKTEYRHKGKLRLLFAGRLSEEKGLKELIQAVRGMPHVELNIIGDGPQREWLQNLLKSSEYSNTAYLGFQKDITAYLTRSDALILPSHREGMPLIALEAAGAGLPILASRVGALPELVKRNGVLFEPKSHKAIVEALNKFWDNRKTISAEARNYSKIITKTYGISAWSAKVKNVYTKTLGTN